MKKDVPEKAAPRLCQEGTRLRYDTEKVGLASKIGHPSLSKSLKLTSSDGDGSILEEKLTMSLKIRADLRKANEERDF